MRLDEPGDPRPLVPIALDADISRARQAIKRVADEVWAQDQAIIEEPEVWGVQSLGPAGITIRLVARPSGWSSGHHAATARAHQGRARSRGN